MAEEEGGGKTACPWEGRCRFFSDWRKSFGELNEKLDSFDLTTSSKITVRRVRSGEDNSNVLRHIIEQSAYLFRKPFHMALVCEEPDPFEIINRVVEMLLELIVINKEERGRKARLSGGIVTSEFDHC